MTRRCEVAAGAVLAAQSRRGLGRCPQSSHSGRRRPAKDEAFSRITGGAVIAGAALVVLPADALLLLLPSAVIVLVLTVLELLLLLLLLIWKEVVVQLEMGFHVSAAVHSSRQAPQSTRERALWSSSQEDRAAA